MITSLTPAPGGGRTALVRGWLAVHGERWRAAGLCGAVSLGVLLPGSWRPAWSGDEAATVIVVRRSYRDLLATWSFDPALEPYYLALKIWSTPSTSPFWLRLPSVLAMAAAVAVLWLFLSTVTERRTAHLGAAVFLLLPATSRYAHDARPYAFAVLFAVLLVHVSRSAGRAPWSWRRRGAVTLCVVLLGLSHAYALLLLPALLLADVLGPRNGRPNTASFAVSAAAGCLLLAPYLWFLKARATGQVDPAPVTALNLVEEFLRLPLGVLSPSLAVICALLVIGFAVLGAISAGRGSSPAHRDLAVLAALWTATPPIVLAVLQAGTGAPGLVARYWLFALPGLAIGVALLSPRLARTRPVAPALGLLVVLVLALPTHVAVRGVNGHLGQRWQLLPAALKVPGLEQAPILVEGWNYRGLLATDPGAVGRMPLALDPAPSGRVNPVQASVGTATYQRFAAQHDVVLAYQKRPGSKGSIPSRQSFGAFRAELRPYPHARVLCSYFGDALGLFTSLPHRTGPDGSAAVAARLEAIAPDHIRCVTTP